jgi:hypothetical protein
MCLIRVKKKIGLIWATIALEHELEIASPFGRSASVPPDEKPKQRENNKEENQKDQVSRTHPVTVHDCIRVQAMDSKATIPNR